LQLIDGEPRAMAPASEMHGTIQSRLDRLIGNHLDAQGGRCRIVSQLGIRIGVRSDSAYRIPDLGVTCAPSVPGNVRTPSVPTSCGATRTVSGRLYPSSSKAGYTLDSIGFRTALTALHNGTWLADAEPG
jgi:hypothetical protein